MMSAQYFEYYTTILRWGAFFSGHAVCIEIIYAVLQRQEHRA